MMERKFLKAFFIRSLVLIAAIIAAVVVFDPFYHYHKPLPGFKSVLNNKEYQCVGTLRNFDYDSLIVGSSVCENYNNHWFDNGFGCRTIKAIRSYGATADLCYLLDIAYESRDLKYVFYNIDPSALSTGTQTTYEASGCPMYLYDKNYLNDISYVLNKDVLLEEIPRMLALSVKSDYDEGDSYNWAQWKTFDATETLGRYNRFSSVIPMYDETYYKDALAGNIALLTAQAAAHPQTTFKFFFSPYSMLWWDNIYRSGERDSYLYNEKQAIAALLEYENVEIYYYQDWEEVITDLDNYMDTVHFSKEINQLICDKMISGEDRLTKENYEARLQNMYELSERIVLEDILEYYSN